MTVRQAAIIAAILLAAILVVGLILLRPMAPENYAEGDFSFGAVTEIRVTAGIFRYDSTAPTLTVGQEDAAFGTLVDFFEGKGFGRTPASVFSQSPPVERVGDIYWTVSFQCASGAVLTAEYIGGDLRLGGTDSPAMTCQDKLTWAQSVHAFIIELYPEPEGSGEAL